jgi:prephenate dehydratase
MFMDRYPEFTDIVYFEHAEDIFEAVAQGQVTAAVAPEQMTNTGFHPKQQALLAAPGSKFHVAAEVAHQYHCCLLGKHGTSFSQIRRVIGHTGSVTQSRRWIEKHLPHAEIEIVHTNSRTAARSVLESDGSIASVATNGMAAQMGLAELATDIDGGSVGNYWAISRDPFFSATPKRLVVAGRFGDEGPLRGKLSALISSLGEAGYVLQTVCSQPSGEALFEYDYLMRLRGEGRLQTVREIIGRFPSARLAGAFEPR